MTESEILRLRDRLLARRAEMLERVGRLDYGWEQMREVPIELEEEAQRLSITEPYDRLDEEGKREIEHIDSALRKISTGDYGICESCGDDIDVKRLEAVPWTRLCIDCAREFERRGRVARRPAEPPEKKGLPDEYEGLSNEQVVALVKEQIEEDGRIDTEELHISLRGGVLYLEGIVAGVPEHQVLMQLITDVLGFSSVIDRLTIDEGPWDDRTAGKMPSGTTLEDRLFNGQEEMTEDLHLAGDEIPYSPPQKPLPHQEGEAAPRRRRRSPGGQRAAP